MIKISETDGEIATGFEPATLQKFLMLGCSSKLADTAKWLNYFLFIAALIL